jgi:hypothetical protein
MAACLAAASMAGSGSTPTIRPTYGAKPRAISPGPVPRSISRWSLRRPTHLVGNGAEEFGGIGRPELLIKRNGRRETSHCVSHPSIWSVLLVCVIIAWRSLPVKLKPAPAGATSRVSRRVVSPSADHHQTNV